MTASAGTKTGAKALLRKWVPLQIERRFSGTLRKPTRRYDTIETPGNYCAAAFEPGGSEMVAAKLGFVVAGAQKAGTTTLDAILRLHPQIQMARTKETHFFDRNHDQSVALACGLEKFFPLEDTRLRGEATPITIYWRPAIRRLHAYNPDVKIILLLRNPVDRAFSGWRDAHLAGRDSLSFSEAIRKGRQRVMEEAEVENLHRVFSYVERSLYGQQLMYLLSYFPLQNIFCAISEEFFTDRFLVLDRIAAFLNIEPFSKDTPSIHLNQSRELVNQSFLVDSDKTYLWELFCDDIASLEVLISRDLSSWYRDTSPKFGSAVPSL